MAGPDGPLLDLLENLKPLTAVEAPKAETGMNVTDLPNDILTNLPHYLYCIDDWYAVIRTCRRFYHACATTKATFPAFFARRFTKDSLPVHCDLLIAGSIRQVADWAVRSQENRQELWDAITMEADEGLIKLGVEVARWNVDEVRAIHEADVKIIDPICEATAEKSKLTHEDHCFSSPRLDDEENPECDLCTWMDLGRASLYSFVIYCNLFHANIEEPYGQRPSNVELLGSTFQRRWMYKRRNSLKYVFSASIYPHLYPHHELQKLFRDLVSGTKVIYPSLTSLLYPKRSQTNLVARCSLEGDILWPPQDIMGNSQQRLRLWDYFRAQSEFKDTGDAEKANRFELFLRIMSHQGLDTLRLLLPNGAPPSDTASNICSRIWELSLEQVSDEKVGDSGERRTRERIGWHSML